MHILHTAYCKSSDGLGLGLVSDRYKMHTTYCILHTAYCESYFTEYNKWRTIYILYSVNYDLQYVVCNMQYAFCNLSDIKGIRKVKDKKKRQNQKRYWKLKNTVHA